MYLTKLSRFEVLSTRTPIDLECSGNGKIGPEEKKKDSSRKSEEVKYRQRFYGMHRVVDPITNSSQQEPGDDCNSIAERHFVTMLVGGIIIIWKQFSQQW